MSSAKLPFSKMRRSLVNKMQSSGKGKKKKFWVSRAPKEPVLSFSDEDGTQEKGNKTSRQKFFPFFLHSSPLNEMRGEKSEGFFFPLCTFPPPTCCNLLNLMGAFYPLPSLPLSLLQFTANGDRASCECRL